MVYLRNTEQQPQSASCFHLLSENRRVKMQLLFPPVSPFLELIQHERKTPDRIILRDHSTGKTATAGQLLQRVSSLRDKLKEELLQNGWESASQDKFIFLIAPPGLEYVVSMLTIFSLGAAMSAQCRQSPRMVS